jgi:hypothetical protein
MRLTPNGDRRTRARDCRDAMMQVFMSTLPSTYSGEAEGPLFSTLHRSLVNLLCSVHITSEDLYESYDYRYIDPRWLNNYLTSLLFDDNGPRLKSKADLQVLLREAVTSLLRGSTEEAISAVLNLLVEDGDASITDCGPLKILVTLNGVPQLDDGGVLQVLELLKPAHVTVCSVSHNVATDIVPLVPSELFEVHVSLNVCDRNTKDPYYPAELRGTGTTSTYTLTVNDHVPIGQVKGKKLVIPPPFLNQGVYQVKDVDGYTITILGGFSYSEAVDFRILLGGSLRVSNEADNVTNQLYLE